MLECKTCHNGCVQVEREKPHTKYRPWILFDPMMIKIAELTGEQLISLSFLQVGGLHVRPFDRESRGQDNFKC